MFAPFLYFARCSHFKQNVASSRCLFLSALLFFLLLSPSCPPLFSACGFGGGGTSQKAEPNTDLKPACHFSNNPWSPLPRQSHSGAITLNYVMCCMTGLSQTCQHGLSYAHCRLFLLILAVFLTHLSVPSARTAL